MYSQPDPDPDPAAREFLTTRLFYHIPFILSGAAIFRAEDINTQKEKERQIEFAVTKRKKKKNIYMGDLYVWLVSFFFLIALLALVVFQVNFYFNLL